MKKLHNLMDDNIKKLQGLINKEDGIKNMDFSDIKCHQFCECPPPTIHISGYCTQCKRHI